MSDGKEHDLVMLMLLPSMPSSTARHAHAENVLTLTCWRLLVTANKTGTVEHYGGVVPCFPRCWTTQHHQSHHGPMFFFALEIFIAEYSAQ